MIALIKSLLLPSGLASLFFVLGLAALVFTKRKSIATFLLALSGSIFVLFSTGVIAALLLSKLEYQYAFLKNPEQYPHSKMIVVLTAYAGEDPLMPQSSFLNSSAAYRILETIHLYQNCHQCKIIVSGTKDSAPLMKNILLESGVPESATEIDDNSPHTISSADNLRDRLGDSTFFLVTSAGHMPRAIGVFRKLGLRPIPAPTDFSLPKDPLQAGLSPSPMNLYLSDLALNEYLGTAWYWLTGKL